MYSKEIVYVIIYSTIRLFSLCLNEVIFIVTILIVCLAAGVWPDDELQDIIIQSCWISKLYDYLNDLACYSLFSVLLSFNSVGFFMCSVLGL